MGEQSGARLAVYSADHKLQKSVNGDAKPEVDQRSKIGTKGVVLCRGWKIRLHTEVNGIANDNGNQIFYPP